jgi:hypothetical protein
MLSIQTRPPRHQYSRAYFANALNLLITDTLNTDYFPATSQHWDNETFFHTKNKTKYDSD